MRRRPLFAAAVKLGLQLQDGGLTNQPTCTGCGERRTPRDFGPSGKCKLCEAKAAGTEDRGLKTSHRAPNPRQD